MGELTETRAAVQRVVQDHAGWVFAAARRRVGDPALAEDVTQAVFLLYWRKGAGIGREGKLAGWLYRAVRYCAANALRLKRIRERHEQEAAMQRKEGQAAGWSEVEAELEGAVERLSEKDRQAVVLRFYRSLSLREVGEAMGIGEEAARKRVDRAVGKLRERLVAKGVEMEVGALGAMVLAHAGDGGPAGLVQSVMAGMGSGTAGVIAKGAAKMMVLTTAKIAACVVAGLTLLASVGAVATTQGSDAGPNASGTVRKEQKTLGPKETLAAFQRDTIALNRRAVRQAFAADGAQEDRLADAVTDYAMAAQSLQNELARRFPGDGRSRGLPHMDPFTVDQATETIEGDNATVMLAGDSTPVRLKRVDGTWRIPVSSFFMDANGDGDIEQQIVVAEQGAQAARGAIEVARRGGSFEKIRDTYKELEANAAQGKRPTTGPATMPADRVGQ